MNKCVLSLLLLATVSLAYERADTSEVMGQILAAVSSKTEDATTMEKLCGMVNDIETSVKAMSAQELADYDHAMGHLRGELQEGKTNLSTVRLEFNHTSSELKKHLAVVAPLPKQLEDVQSREQQLQQQRDLLAKECEEDVSTQHARLDAVKSDLAVLSDAFSHLGKLKGIGGEPNTALIQVEEQRQDKCTLPEFPGYIVRCQNGFVVPVPQRNGTLSTAPPGNGMAYHNQMQCGFRLSPENPGPLDKVELDIVALDTIPGVDFVKVYDGPRPDESKLLGKFSGKTVPNTIRTKTHNEMLVTFSMDNTQQTEVSQGFVGRFRGISIPLLRNTAVNACAGTAGIPLTLTGTKGFVAEDSRPEYADALQARAGGVYSNGLNCRWMIQGEEGQRIRVHFTFLQTQVGSEFVVVHDGATEKDSVALRASGSSIPTDLISTGAAVLITYVSDYSVEGDGFHLSWCVEGTTCPEPEVVPLPSPVPLNPNPTIPYNESAPEAVAVPDFPSLALQPVGGMCCLEQCNSHGVCNPTTCVCACYVGFTGSSCATPIAANSNSLLQLDSGLEAAPSAAQPVAATVEDECGDDVEDDEEGAMVVKRLNLDPLTSLLGQLKFELQRSLTYEHDTTNTTHRQCARDLEQQDKDLAALQQEGLVMGKRLAELDTHGDALKEKKAALELSVRSLTDFVSDVTHRIDARQATRDSRSSGLSQELKTLSSMRDIITQIGSYECKPASESPVFEVKQGKECVGEVQPASHMTSDASDCESLCGLGCVAFSFNSNSGCRFFSDIRDTSAACSVGAVSCSCHVKKV